MSDEDEFTALFRAHYARVLAFVARRTDPARAHDVVAETFATAWRHFSRLPADPLPWLYRVARNSLANEERAARRQSRLAGRIAQRRVEHTPDHALSVIADAGLRQALGRLSPTDREALLLIGWEELEPAAAALVLVLAVVTAPLADRSGRSRASVLAVVTPLALCTEPVRQTLGLGQVNLLLFALVALDLLVLGRRGSPWAGVGVGLAAAIKLTPGLFIGYLLVTRQWRAARTASVAVAALTGGAFLLAPGESARYFGALMWQTGRVGAAGATANQSLTGLLARAAGSTVAPAGWWLPPALLVLLLGLRRAGQAHRPVSRSPH